MKGFPNLTFADEQFLKIGTCPDCQGDLYEGPCGGMMMNIRCGTCGARFNITNPELQRMSPFFAERLSYGKSIPPILKNLKNL